MITIEERAYEYAHRNKEPFLSGFEDAEINAYSQGYKDAAKEFGWHPYPDEKPDEDTRVFVNICNKYYESRLFCEDTFGLVDNAVVAWMPIPEYKEGGEE